MSKANEFSQPISQIGGVYGQNSWPGYIHKQVRVEGGRHIGDDYNGPGGGNTDLGVDVFSVANGVVEKIIPWNGKYGYGNHVFIKHELAPYLQAKYNCLVIYSHYAHLDAFRCREGQEVTKGQVIAKLGNSGTKYAHLHLEIRKPTGKGYENYPSNESIAWIDKYYFAPFPFIEENKKEPEQAPTASPQPDTTSNETPDIPPESPSVPVPDPVIPDTTTDSAGSAEELPTGSTDSPTNGTDIPTVDVPQPSEEMVPPIPQPAPVRPLSIMDLLKKIWHFFFK